MSTCLRVHAALPPVGLRELKTLPALSATKHADADAHETLFMLASSRWAMLQAEAPPAGSVDVRTCPKPSIATHSETDGHDKSMMPIQSTEAPTHDDASPGCAEVATCPDPSTATQDSADGQATAVRPLVPSTLAVTQVDAPPVGLVELLALPTRSIATHSDGDGHEIPSNRPFTGSRNEKLQAGAPPVGSSEISSPPAASTTAQKDGAAHDTAANGAGQLSLLPHAKISGSTRALVHAVEPPVGLVEVTASP